MYRYAAITDIGPQFKVNDDRILIGNTIIGTGEYQGESQESFILLAVADGVGGLQMGAEAAEETLKIFSEMNQPNMGRMNIRNSVELANKAVLLKQKELNMINGLRTTLSALYIDNQVAYVVNAGDSRVYRFREHQLELLSKDHSIVQNLIDTGELTEEESYSHPKRNIITKCIGDEERVNARIVDFSDDINTGDIYLLCSDGISDSLRNEEIEQIVMNVKEKALLEVCQIFIQKAIERGSTDNISICIMRKEK